MIISEINKIIEATQMAVDIVLDSEHDRNKVAACIFHPNHPEIEPFAAINHRPDCLKAVYDWEERVGGSSQFIHAELAAIKGFKGPLQGAHICVTDPFCPNCAKHIAESGIAAVTIDHKGFAKDFIARKGNEFGSMSMLVADKAGINVTVVNRKEKTLQSILKQIAPTRKAPSAVEFYDIADGMSLKDAAKGMAQRLGVTEAWATAFVRERDGSLRGILVLEALPPGFTPQDYISRDKRETGKYRFPVDPLSRLVVIAKRMGFELADFVVACSHTPSSRSLVNALGYDVKGLLLMSDAAGHDEMGKEAIAEIEKYNLMKVDKLI